MLAVLEIETFYLIQELEFDFLSSQLYIQNEISDVVRLKL